MSRHSGEYLPDDPDWVRVMSVTGVDRLEAYATRQNRLCWVHNSGNPFFVAKRDKPGGTIEHFVDRKA